MTWWLTWIGGAAASGFFCDNKPIDQTAAEAVVAASDGVVELHLRVSYAGTTPAFAWVVPVPALPEVSLSSDALFAALDDLTRPTFVARRVTEGVCAGELDTAPAAPDDTDPAPVVTGLVLVDRVEIGPYEVVTLQADDAAPLTAWLAAEGFLIPAGLEARLDPYLRPGGAFVAARLTREMGAGDVAPIALRWAGSEIRLPLVLTSVAATPDLPVTLHVLGQHRAVPDNYLHVRVNDAAYDWDAGRSDAYRDLVRRAVDEAGGQAFATDHAGPADGLAGRIAGPDRYGTAGLAEIADAEAYLAALAARGFTGTPAVRAALRQWMPMPAEVAAAGTSEAAFYACVSCYTDAVTFDPAGLTAALEARVAAPARAAQALVDAHPYLTRLSTVISPAEMTVDPVFVENPDLGPVASRREATVVTSCGDGGAWAASPRRVELADGRAVDLPARDAGATPPGPAAEVVEDLGASGAGRVIVDHTPDPPAGETDAPDTDDAAGAPDDPPTGCGCAADPSGAGGALAAAGLAAGIRRRRRAAR